MVDLSRVCGTDGTPVAEQVGEVEGVPVYRCEAGGAMACRLASIANTPKPTRRRQQHLAQRLYYNRLYQVSPYHR